MIGCSKIVKGLKPARFGLARALLLLVVGALVSASAAACATAPAQPTQTLTVGSPALEQAALLYLAADQGLFAQRGLNVVVLDYASGPAALDALRSGAVDVAATAEYPLVRQLLAGEPLAVLATSDKFENDYVVARADSGIRRTADLAGKRVGLARGTIVEFYLARLLELAGVPAGAVTVIDLPPAGVVDALVAGQVDAVVTWQPYVGQAGAKLPDAVVLPVQSSQPVFGLLVAQTAWVAAHGDTAIRFLQALDEAETRLNRAPAAAQAVVVQRLRYDPTYLAAVWPQHQFGLSLDQALVIAMKDEAQWMIRNQLTPAAQLPDFAAFMDTAALEAVKPGAISLVR